MGYSESKRKSQKCIIKRVIIQKENDPANAVERANPVAPTVDKLHISVHSIQYVLMLQYIY
jgi:hypothetical protein